MQKTRSNYQHIIFNNEGFILQSNERIIQNKDITREKASDLISFYENVFPHILDVLRYQKSITFKAINSPAQILPGIYDFVFALKANSVDSTKPLIECWIIERTEYYTDIQQFRQNQRSAIVSNASSLNPNQQN